MTLDFTPFKTTITTYPYHYTFILLLIIKPNITKFTYNNYITI